MALRRGRFLVPVLVVLPLAACGMVAGLSGYDLDRSESGVDAAVRDTSLGDVQVDSAETVDTTVADTFDATLVDTFDATPDVAETDTLETIDSGVDTGPDTFVMDTGPDTSVMDTGPDTFVMDTGPDTLASDAGDDTAKPDAVGTSCLEDAAACGESVCCKMGPCAGVCVHNCSITKMCSAGQVCCTPDLPCANMCVKNCGTAPGCTGGGTCKDSGLCGP